MRCRLRAPYAISTTALFLFAVFADAAQCADAYEIEYAIDDEYFIVNGEKFQAQTYCLGWEEGERVVFVEGSPLGVCVSAELFNIDRKESCFVWCE